MPIVIVICDWTE